MPSGTRDHERLGLPSDAKVSQSHNAVASVQGKTDTLTTLNLVYEIK